MNEWGMNPWGQAAVGWDGVEWCDAEMRIITVHSSSLFWSATLCTIDIASRWKQLDEISRWAYRFTSNTVETTSTITWNEAWSTQMINRIELLYTLVLSSYEYTIHYHVPTGDSLSPPYFTFGCWAVTNFCSRILVSSDRRGATAWQQFHQNQSTTF